MTETTSNKQYVRFLVNSGNVLATDLILTRNGKKLRNYEFFMTVVARKVSQHSLNVTSLEASCVS